MDDQTYAVKERSSDSIVINHGNVSTDLLKYIPILTNSEYWHAFYIQNVNNITRNEILKIVLDYVYPLDLIPVRFEREGNHCMFLARNCAEAILKLCKDNLTIPHPNKTGKLYQCEIVLKHATLSTLQSEENIYEVVQSLFEEPNKTLNLQKFSDNVGLVEYSPLSQPKILSYVLYLSKKLEPTCIKLNSNEIRSLYPFEAVSGLHSVKQLDLRNNLIDDISELSTLKLLNLVELWLDGNPLCDKYEEHIYIDKIREILPLVVVLDGVPIGKRGGSTLKIKNYLCKNEGFDLVDQFIAHFFPIYDYKRILLQSLYHPKAMFSLTCLYKEGLINSGTTKLDSYEPINRNLLSHSFLSKPQENIIIGRGEILKKIDTLPKTEHDGHSFCVDLIHYTGSLAVISINGIFREVPKAAHESNRLMGFHRIFVLGRTKSEYYICNDLLHVYNALNHQVSSAFTVGDTVKIGVLPAASTPKEKEKVQEAMILTTGIDREWARRLLEDIDYDLIKCLKKFMDLLKKDKIPQEAFNKNSKETSKDCFMRWMIPQALEVGVDMFKKPFREEIIQYLAKNSSNSSDYNPPSQSVPTNIGYETADKNDDNPEKLEEDLWLWKYENLSVNIVDDRYKSQKNYSVNVNQTIQVTGSSVTKETPVKHPTDASYACIDMELSDDETNSPGVNSLAASSVSSLICKSPPNRSIPSQSSSQARNALHTEIARLEDVKKKKAVEINRLFNKFKSQQAAKFVDKPVKSDSGYELSTTPTLSPVFNPDTKKYNANENTPLTPVTSSLHAVAVPLPVFAPSLRKVTPLPPAFVPPLPKGTPPRTPVAPPLPVGTPPLSSVAPPLSSVAPSLPAVAPTLPLHNIVPLKSDTVEKVQSKKNCAKNKGRTNLIDVLKNRTPRSLLHDFKSSLDKNGDNALKKSSTDQDGRDNLIDVTKICINKDLLDESKCVLDKNEDRDNEKHVNIRSILTEEQNASQLSKSGNVNKHIKSGQPSIILSRESTISPDILIKTDTKYEDIKRLALNPPKITLLNGKWTYVKSDSELEFKFIYNTWRLIKNEENKEWQYVQDDFSKHYACWKKHFPSYPNEKIKHTLRAKCMKSFLKTSFDTIPNPVTYWDFPPSVPWDMKPPKYANIFVKGKHTEICVTPDSRFGFISVGGTWVLLAENASAEWEVLTKIEGYIAWMEGKWTTQSHDKIVTPQEVLGYSYMPRVVCISKVWVSFPISDLLLKFIDGCWILHKKDIYNKWCIAQDYFSHQFICGKRHFQGDGESLLKPLHAPQVSCLPSTFDKKIFDSIGFPTTWFDFLSTVPDDLRPPQQYWVLDKELCRYVLKNITPDCGYGFVSINGEWLFRKKLEDGTWIPVRGRVSKAADSSPSTELLEKRIDSINCSNTKTAKSDNEPNARVSVSKCDDNQNKSNGHVLGNVSFQVTLENNIKAHDLNRDYKMMLRKLKLTEQNISLEPCIPKLTLLNGTWEIISGNSKRKFYRSSDNFWILVEKKSTDKWVELKDDFMMAKARMTDIENFNELMAALGGNVFDAISIPVTFFDFPNSIPGLLRPPYKVVTDDQSVIVGPNSGYAFLSIQGNWVLLKQDKQGNWLAVKNENKIAIEQKLKNTPKEYQLLFNKQHEITQPFLNLEDVNRKKLESATCSFIQLVAGPLPDTSIKPLTYYDIEISEKLKPPKFALTEVDGQQQWAGIRPDSGTGFVFVEGRWVLLTQLKCKQWIRVDITAYENCILGYFLANNRWIVMKKYMLGGKWTPLFDPEKMPVTYWDFIGPEDEKPPRNAFVEGQTKSISVHKNSGMGFVRKHDVWILMKKENDDWTVVTDNHNVCTYKLINGFWVMVIKDKDQKWIPFPVKSSRPVTYWNFNGLPDFAPPKQVAFHENGIESWKIINQESGMGFILDEGIWVLVKEDDNGKLMEIENIHAKVGRIGYKKVNGKFKIIKRDANGKWRDIEKLNMQNELNASTRQISEEFSFEDKFQDAIPLTYEDVPDNIPEHLMPPKYAMLPDLDGDLKWSLVDRVSGYAFVQDETVWRLRQWILGKGWVECEGNREEGRLGYKIIDSRWVSMKRLENDWTPTFNPFETPRVAALCVGNMKPPSELFLCENGINRMIEISPHSGMGFVKDESGGSHIIWVLMEKHTNSWLRYTHFLYPEGIYGYSIIEGKFVMMKKIGDQGWTSGHWNEYEQLWEFSKSSTSEINTNYPTFVDSSEMIDIFDFEDQEKVFSISGKTVVDNSELLKCYCDCIKLPEHLRPPHYVGLKVGNKKFKWVSSRNYKIAFVTRGDIWISVMKYSTKYTSKWYFQNNNLGYKLFDDRWVSMKLIKREWTPIFDPKRTPRRFCDTIGSANRPPKRIPFYENGVAKWISTLKDVNLGFMKYDDAWIFMKRTGIEWFEMRDDLEPESVIAFKLIDYRWKRVKRNAEGKWIPCSKQLLLPVAYCDIIGPQEITPPRSVIIFDENLVQKRCGIDENSMVGFVNDNGVWVLMKHQRKCTWIRYPIIPQKDGTYGYKVYNNKCTLMKKENGCWEPEEELLGRRICFDLETLEEPCEIEMATEDDQSGNTQKSINYHEMDEQPRSVLIVQNGQLTRIWGPRGNLGMKYDKRSDVWVLTKPKTDRLFGYKVIDKRWVIMKKNVDDKWTPTFDPTKTPRTFYDTIGPYYKRPPWRVILNTDGIDRWKIISEENGLGFIKQSDMWVLMKKQNDGTWVEFEDPTDMEQLGFKIMNRKWTKFKKKIGCTWTICPQVSLPTLKYDYVFHEDNGPPKCLYFISEEYLAELPECDIGFQLVDGAWVPMKCDADGSWREFDLFPNQKGLFGYISTDLVKKVDGKWTVVNMIKNNDGTWAMNSAKNVKNIEERNGNNCQERFESEKSSILPSITSEMIDEEYEDPFALNSDINLSKESIRSVDEHPNFLLLNVSGMPELIAVTKESGIVFQKEGEVWIPTFPLTSQSARNTITGYELIDNRWVTMKKTEQKWVPTFDPFSTPRTFYDTIGPLNERPPLRVVINKGGVHMWEMVTGINGLGFINEDSWWILMKKHDDEWIYYRDFNNKLLGYKVENGEWRKYHEFSYWKLCPATYLPKLQCDYVYFDNAPPNTLFLHPQENNSSYLHPSSGRGFQLEDGAWVLVELKQNGIYSKVDLFPSQGYFGYMRNIADKNRWRIVKRDHNGLWKFVRKSDEGLWIFDDQMLVYPFVWSSGMNILTYKNPVPIYELLKGPQRKQPPSSVVIKLNGILRRIELTKKKWQYTFHNEDDVWILLKLTKERTGKAIQSNSAYLFGYKLIDNRWVVMKKAWSGIWETTFDPVLTPRNYFDTIGIGNERPPRGVILNEDGVDIWKVIGEEIGMGFLKEDDMWILMKEHNGLWTHFEDINRDLVGYKFINCDWHKFKKTVGGIWELCPPPSEVQFDVEEIRRFRKRNKRVRKKQRNIYNNLIKSDHENILIDNSLRGEIESEQPPEKKKRPDEQVENKQKITNEACDNFDKTKTNIEVVKKVCEKQRKRRRFSKINRVSLRLAAKASVHDKNDVIKAQEVATTGLYFEQSSTEKNEGINLSSQKYSDTSKDNSLIEDEKTEKEFDESHVNICRGNKRKTEHIEVVPLHKETRESEDRKIVTANEKSDTSSAERCRETLTLGEVGHNNSNKKFDETDLYENIQVNEKICKEVHSTKERGIRLDEEEELPSKMVEDAKNEIKNIVVEEKSSGDCSSNQNVETKLIHAENASTTKIFETKTAETNKTEPACKMEQVINESDTWKKHVEVEEMLDESPTKVKRDISAAVTSSFDENNILRIENNIEERSRKKKRPIEQVNTNLVNNGDISKAISEDIIPLASEEYDNFKKTKKNIEGVKKVSEHKKKRRRLSKTKRLSKRLGREGESKSLHQENVSNIEAQKVVITGLNFEQFPPNLQQKMTWSNQDLEDMKKSPAKRNEEIKRASQRDSDNSNDNSPFNEGGKTNKESDESSMKICPGNKRKIEQVKEIPLIKENDKSDEKINSTPNKKSDMFSIERSKEMATSGRIYHNSNKKIPIQSDETELPANKKICKGEIHWTEKQEIRLDEEKLPSQIVVGAKRELKDILKIEEEPDSTGNCLSNQNEETLNKIIKTENDFVEYLSRPKQDPEMSLNENENSSILEIAEIEMTETAKIEKTEIVKTENTEIIETEMLAEPIKTEQTFKMDQEINESDTTKKNVEIQGISEKFSPKVKQDNSEVGTSRSGEDHESCIKNSDENDINKIYADLLELLMPFSAGNVEILKTANSENNVLSDKSKYITEMSNVIENEPGSSLTPEEPPLNSVELYLAAHPSCEMSCPELQNLLREYRPATEPDKLLRKKFRLPDGTKKLLTIPKMIKVSLEKSAVKTKKIKLVGEKLKSEDKSNRKVKTKRRRNIITDN